MSDDQKFMYRKTFDKYLKLYCNDAKKDIKFIFEDSKTEIKAHKLILETVSPVFETMFNGSFAEKDTATIHDIDPEIFQKLIDVIYMQPVMVFSLEEAVDLCNVAEMYDVEDLKDIASDFMLENCSYKNCFHLLAKAKLFNLNEVAEKCRNILRENFTEDTKHLEILIQDMDLDEDTFIEFLAINESPDSALYQMLEFFVTTGKLKSYQKALGQIRFLTMSIEEVVLVRLVSEADKLAIISNIEANKKQTEPILPMPEHLSSSTTVRQEIPSNSFFYKYFWIMMLLKCPVEHFENQFKRVSTIKNLFTTDQIKIMKEVLQSKLNGKDLEINDYYIVKQILTNSGMLKWFDLIYHGEKQVAIFGKDLCGIKMVSLDFDLNE